MGSHKKHHDNKKHDNIKHDKHHEHHSSSAREGFSTNLGVLAATLGSAVGLGNLWKFPYLAGDNGGASFLFLYIIATLLIGLPVMIAEIMIGRKGQANAVTSFRRLSDDSAWSTIGVLGALSAFIILGFYTEVAGWVFAYLFKSIILLFSFEHMQNPNLAFRSLVESPWQSLIWQWVVIVSVAAIIIKGVNKGIEKMTKRLMPILFVLLIIICIRSLTLSGASQGLEFLLKPDISKLTAKAVLLAMGLAFFKLSLGMGTMITYGSYFKDNQNIPATAFKVMIADLTVSILAGIAIFPAVFSFGLAPSSGPSLLFITIPQIFSTMFMGNFFMFLFFLLSSVAAIGAMVSLMEVPVSCIREMKLLSRTTATFYTASTLIVFGATAALSNSSLKGFTLFDMTCFDFYDYITSNIFMPIGGILTCIFCAVILKKERIYRYVSNNGKLKNRRICLAMYVLLKYVSPILILLVMLNTLGMF